MLTQVSAEMVSQIVESVFITMLNLEVVPQRDTLGSFPRSTDSGSSPVGESEWDALIRVQPMGGLPVHRPVSFDGTTGHGKR